MNRTAAWTGKIRNQLSLYMVLITPASLKGSRTLWYLSVSLDFYLEDMDPAEYAEKAGALEETAEQVLARLNEYTGHTVNAEIIYPAGSDQKGASYHHWYDHKRRYRGPVRIRYTASYIRCH